MVELSPIFKEKLLEKIPLSVAIITKNEEENIRQCLQSVAFAGQIVIIDSGSTDSTLQVAAQFGCEVYHEEWRGFGPQKQSAIEKCRYPWILVLDADERIPEDTADIIKKIVTDPDKQKLDSAFPARIIFRGDGSNMPAGGLIGSFAYSVKKQDG